MSQRVSLFEALLHTLATTVGVTALAVALGIALGSAAGRKAGLYDDLLRRMLEFSGALPLVVAIPLLSRVWPTTWSCIVVLGSCPRRNTSTVCTVTASASRSCRAIASAIAPSAD